MFKVLPAGASAEGIVAGWIWGRCRRTCLQLTVRAVPVACIKCRMLSLCAERYSKRWRAATRDIPFRNNAVSLKTPPLLQNVWITGSFGPGAAGAFSLLGAKALP